MVCSPTRCTILVRSLRERRAAININAPRPIIIWEPIPDLCTPAELENLREAATLVDIISPNGEELADFFATGTGPETQRLSRQEMVTSLLAKCDPHDPSAAPTVVVRDGADGSRLYTHNKAVHFRAYHQDSGKVIDPTGGGNTYLGGLAMGLSSLTNPNAADTLDALSSATSSSQHLDDDVERAAAEEVSRGRRSTTMPLPLLLTAVTHATIAASFAIEQVGLPVLDPARRDLWNGEAYTERYRAYLRREGEYLAGQLRDQ